MSVKQHHWVQVHNLMPELKVYIRDFDRDLDTALTFGEVAAVALNQDFELGEICGRDHSACDALLDSLLEIAEVDLHDRPTALFWREHSCNSFNVSLHITLLAQPQSQRPKQFTFPGYYLEIA
jgi:hypothetical protein